MSTTIEPYPYVQPPCSHPDHAPPMHLHIPVGYRARHTCPACGLETIIHPITITWGGNGVLDCPQIT